MTRLQLEAIERDRAARERLAAATKSGLWFNVIERIEAELAERAKPTLADLYAASRARDEIRSDGSDLALVMAEGLS
jgi:hypothetical protein